MKIIENLNKRVSNQVFGVKNILAGIQFILFGLLYFANSKNPFENFLNEKIFY